MTHIKVHLFVCGHPIVPAFFVENKNVEKKKSENTLLSPLNWLGSLVKVSCPFMGLFLDSLFCSINLCVYLTPTRCHLDHRLTVVSLETILRLAFRLCSAATKAVTKAVLASPGFLCHVNF